MAPHDCTVYVYGDAKRTIPVITWLVENRLPYINIEQQHKIPHPHHITMERTNGSVIVLLYIFIGKYSQTPILHLEELKSWFTNNKHRNNSILPQLSNLKIVILPKPSVLPGMCPARNVKDNQPCAYAINPSSNGYCGSHFKCSQKRLKLCIYQSKTSKHTTTFKEECMVLRGYILNIHTYDAHETENIEMGISSPSMPEQQSILSTHTERPLLVAGWGDNLTVFTSIIACRRWVALLASFSRCLYTATDTGTQCNNLSKQHSMFCNDHTYGINVNILKT